MNYGLLLRTVKHLKPTQVFHQVKYRVIKPRYKALSLGRGVNVNGSVLMTEPITKPRCLDGDKFTFLNLEHEFAGWGFNEYGNLWTYNQNYFDWLGQEGMTEEEGCKWIDRFIEDVLCTEISQKSESKSSKYPFSLDPYPIALRSINWVKFFCRYPESSTKERVDALYSQYRLLAKKLEYHLLGNHLLEDAYALYFVGSWLVGSRFMVHSSWLEKTKMLLLEQLEEQILPDGAHYEQSPMYHCILLDRLLDCINISLTTDDTDFTDKLKEKAERMLGHLESVKWNSGSLPLLNDSANGIAPTTSQLFYYAKGLGLKWKKIPMKECGYRKMLAGNMEAIVDVGNITATYQPGHTHADTFNYELRIEGKPFVVDTGISTYNKTERRQYERGTAAHNCVSPNGMNSSEVWGGFRVGQRCYVEITEIAENRICAKHDGFSKPCERTFNLKDDMFTIEDRYDGEAVSYIHLADGADEKRISVEGAKKIETKPWKYSTEYNNFHDGKVMEIHFNGNLRYSIQ